MPAKPFFCPEVLLECLFETSLLRHVFVRGPKQWIGHKVPHSPITFHFEVFKLLEGKRHYRIKSDFSEGGISVVLQMSFFH